MKNKQFFLLFFLLLLCCFGISSSLNATTEDRVPIKREQGPVTAEELAAFYSQEASEISPASRKFYDPDLMFTEWNIFKKYAPNVHQPIERYIASLPQADIQNRRCFTYRYYAYRVVPGHENDEITSLKAPIQKQFETWCANPTNQELVDCFNDKLNQYFGLSDGSIAQSIIDRYCHFKVPTLKDIQEGRADGTWGWYLVPDDIKETGGCDFTRHSLSIYNASSIFPLFIDKLVKYSLQDESMTIDLSRYDSPYLIKDGLQTPSKSINWGRGIFPKKVFDVPNNSHANASSINYAQAPKGEEYYRLNEYYEDFSDQKQGFSANDQCFLLYVEK